ncbi:hypothetical protein RSAG8_09138, partial [Rhizoctonia solani AG-8 WAC10335]
MRLYLKANQTSKASLSNLLLDLPNGLHTLGVQGFEFDQESDPPHFEQSQETKAEILILLVLTGDLTTLHKPASIRVAQALVSNYCVTMEQNVEVVDELAKTIAVLWGWYSRLAFGLNIASPGESFIWYASRVDYQKCITDQFSLKD